jgi:hypothetical protein
VLATLKDLQLAMLNVFRVKKIVKWEYSSHFERGQIVVARLVPTSVTKSCHIIGCIESDSF